MTRWVPIPMAVSRSKALSRVSHAGRLLWFAIRLLRGEIGLDAEISTEDIACDLQLQVPAILAGVDIAAGLVELESAGLVQRSDSRVLLLDFDRSIELSKCNRCHSINPDSRHGRCPSCRADDERRGTTRSGRAQNATSAASRDSTGASAVGNAACADGAQTCADETSATLPYPTQPDPTHLRLLEPEGDLQRETHENRKLAIWRLLNGTDLRSRSANRDKVLTDLANLLARSSTPSEVAALIETAKGGGHGPAWLSKQLEQLSFGHRGTA